MNENSFWSISNDQLSSGLVSSVDRLTNSEAFKRLEQVGPNVLQTKRKATPFGLFLNQFKSPIILLLLFATVMSAFLKDWPDAVIILAIVLGSAVLSFVQEHSASSAVEKLRAQVTTKATVLRDGQPKSIPAEQVVPGDVVLLSAGSLIPADGVVIEAKDFFVDQAVLTGEAFPVEKKDAGVAEDASLAERVNTVFMGTTVRSGTATEFERGIRHLGFLLSEVMLVLVLLIFFVNVFFHKPILDSLLFSIALAVGLTPQLLPAIININLSRGAQRMAEKGVIVRRMESIENFGSMDLLCTDKTGTLTEGVVQLDAALDTQGQPSDESLRYAFLNAHFQTGLTNSLDEAIVAKAQSDISDVIKLDEVPYDFVRKRLSVVVQDGLQPLMITKGALENILAVCSQIQQAGSTAPIDEAQQAQVLQRYREWSEQGFRVLGVAVKKVTHQPAYHRQDEQNLTFVGFLLFFDPPKAGVRETIEQLARLGVQLKIITGDNHLVALHTAQAVGLDVTGVLTGRELDDMKDEALWHAANKTSLFTEVDPNQKERIILALKKSGHVVGYMGDGINDAPALHSAEVGLSVENAVDVAKEAADFVLLKQDLGVLQQGIIEGRKTFANTLKYVFMATSANFGNMFSVAGASLFLPFLPMLPKQILLINFLTDLPEMTIAGDNVDAVFIEKPHRWDVNFIRRFMFVFGLLSSIFDFLTFGILLWLLPAHAEKFHTGWFIESVLSASLVVFAVRTRLPFRRSRPNRAMLIVTSLVALVTLLLPYSPLAGILGFKPLPPAILVGIAAIVLAYFVSAELTKRWFFPRYGTEQG